MEGKKGFGSLGIIALAVLGLWAWSKKQVAAAEANIPTFTAEEVDSPLLLQTGPYSEILQQATVLVGAGSGDTLIMTGQGLQPASAILAAAAQAGVTLPAPVAPAEKATILSFKTDIYQPPNPAPWSPGPPYYNEPQLKGFKVSWRNDSEFDITVKVTVGHRNGGYVYLTPQYSTAEPGETVDLYFAIPGYLPPGVIYGAGVTLKSSNGTLLSSESIGAGMAPD